jgi:hypothetical protein
MSAAAREHKRAATEQAAPELGNPSIEAAANSEEKILHISAPPDFVPQSRSLESGEESVAPIPMPIAQPLPAPAVLEATDLTVLDDVEVLDEYSFLSPEDLKIVSDLAGQVRPEHDHLTVEFIGSPEFRGGKTIPVFVMVCRGSRREVIRGSEIMVKILGSSFRPVIYHAVSDKNGLAQINVDVPHFVSGRATALARAKHGNDEVEIRRPVVHG